MNNLNFPIASDFSTLIKRNQVKTTFKESGITTRTIQGKEGSVYNLNAKLGGKIKFILGFIYFFSLLFFTIKLFI